MYRKNVILTSRNFEGKFHYIKFLVDTASQSLNEFFKLRFYTLSFFAYANVINPTFLQYCNIVT